MTKIVLGLLTVLCLASTASAEATKLAEAATDPMGSGLLPVVSMHDMQGRRWGVAASPFAWKTDKIVSDGHCCSNAGGPATGTDSLPAASGFGGSAAFMYEFTPHWGAQVFFGAARGAAPDLGSSVSGLAPTAAYTGTPGGAGMAGGKLTRFDGTVVGAMATWDPFDNPRGFRMPISVGLFEGWQEFDFDHSFTNPNNGAAQTETVRFRRSYPGVAAAVSFDFLVFKEFRAMPGILVGQGFAGQEAGYDYVVRQNGGASRAYHHELTGTPGFGTVYLAMNYRPWGVGYTVTFVPTFASTHALTWSKRWGGSGDAR